MRTCYHVIIQTGTALIAVKTYSKAAALEIGEQVTGEFAGAISVVIVKDIPEYEDDNTGPR